jgi:hypothetical protein
MENFNNRIMSQEVHSIRESQTARFNGNVNGTVFQNDQSFRDFLKSNLKRPKVSQEFIQSIKDKIKLA